jgi:predicted nucleic acid-binding protein
MAKKSRPTQRKLDAFVLDASVSLAWYFSDEADPYAEDVARSLPAFQALVPAVWPLEVANAILMGERRKRGTAATATQWAGLLTSLPIAVDEPSFGRVFRDVLELARAQYLSVYDASYLELAIRSGLPLATLDDRLRQAAAAAGVRPFEP